MDTQNFLFNILISIIITLAVVLIPYTVIRLITHRQIQDKTAKIITVVYSIISFLIFLVIGILTDSESISVFPAILWNAVGYMIIRPNNKLSDKKTATDNAPIIEQKLKKKNSQKDDLKKKRSVKKTVIVLSLTTVVFLVSTIALSIGLISINLNNNNLSTQISELEKSVEEKNNEISRLDRQALNQQGTINSIQNELDFYDSYVACVDDDSYYHKPDCIYFDDSSFYIYNTEAAEARGYTECPYCF